MINNKNAVNVSFNIENKSINIKLEQKERYMKTFKEYKLDATVIQIRSKDKVYEDYFLEPELGYDYNLLVGKEIFIPQFPKFKEIKNARGTIKEIHSGSPNEFTHLAKTQKGSSGSPIFLKGNKKVLGIHKEGSLIKQENYGDFIAPIISIITNDIMARLNAIMINNNQINNNQINNNSSFNSQYKFGLVNFNNNSNILVRPVLPVNQIQPVNKILNQDIQNKNNPMLVNLNNPTLNNKSNRISNNMNDNINNNIKIKIMGNVNNNNITNKIFINNKLETQGQMEAEIEEKYIGPLLNGLRHGKGKVYYKKNGNIKYEGEFVNGKYEGYGEIFNEDGKVKYKGYFKNNKYEGNGKLFGNDFD